MELQNRHGEAVDPVPFLVVVSLAFALAYVALPGTLMELGLSLGAALGVTTVGYGGVAAFAFYRLVWRTYPTVRADVPQSLRLRTITYGAVAGVLLLLLVSLLAALR